MRKKVKHLEEERTQSCIGIHDQASQASADPAQQGRHKISYSQSSILALCI